jgi:hypothetical protein
MKTSHPREYSADVQIVMFVDDEEISVGRVGPNYAVLREQREIPQSNARIVVTIDGHKHERKVFLYDGVRRGSSIAWFI